MTAKLDSTFTALIAANLAHDALGWALTQSFSFVQEVNPNDFKQTNLAMCDIQS